jgi:dTDP-4-amino-4,6-dideoxygalactose transaminase
VWKVQLFKLNFDEREVAAVAEVISSGWLTMGDKTKVFEAQFGVFLGEEVKATAVSNGTAALHMALLALEVGAGDEVIIPSLTFVADINTVMLVGATPVLADCTSLEDWNIDPAEIERNITAKTKAVMIVHYAGYPCDMDAITDICKRHNLKLIEDCAHAPGARYKGRSVGTFGDVNCYSFFTNKNLSVGEGGMVTTLSAELDQRLKYLRSHGMTTLTLDRHEGRAISYDVIRPGLNYRIDEMRAALGLVQLEKLDHAHQQRARIVMRYNAAFKDIDGLVIPFLHSQDSVSVYHIYPVMLPAACDRLKVIAALKAEGVQSSIHYPTFQEFTAYKDMNLGETPITCQISSRELTLPLYPTMSDEEVDIVIAAFRKALSTGQN